MRLSRFKLVSHSVSLASSLFVRSLLKAHDSFFFFPFSVNVSFLVLCALTFVPIVCMRAVCAVCSWCNCVLHYNWLVLELVWLPNTCYCVCVRACYVMCCYSSGNPGQWLQFFLNIFVFFICLYSWSKLKRTQSLNDSGTNRWCNSAESRTGLENILFVFFHFAVQTGSCWLRFNQAIKLS